MTKELKRIIRLLEKYCDDIEIMSYGLYPNPTGFCYMKYNEIDIKDEIRLNSMLESLSSEDTDILKLLYIGQ